jgi:hypothetical protein
MDDKGEGFDRLGIKLGFSGHFNTWVYELADHYSMFPDKLTKLDYANLVQRFFDAEMRQPLHEHLSYDSTRQNTENYKAAFKFVRDHLAPIFGKDNSEDPKHHALYIPCRFYGLTNDMKGHNTQVE